MRRTVDDLPDRIPEIPPGLPVDLLEEVLAGALGQRGQEHLFRQGRVLQGGRADIGVGIQEEILQIRQDVGAFGAGQQVGLGDLEAGLGPAGAPRRQGQGFPVLLPGGQGGQFHGEARGVHRARQQLGLLFDDRLELRGQLLVDVLHRLSPFVLFLGGRAIHVAHEIEQGHHHLQIPANGFGGGFVLGQGLQDWPMHQPVRGAGDERQQPGGGEVAAQALDERQLPVRGDLGPQQRQIPELEPILFRQFRQEGEVKLRHRPPPQERGRFREPARAG